MGIRFRKRIKIIPGVHMNLSKSGSSVNVGPKGANVSVGQKGVYLNAGIQGSGVYSRERIDQYNNELFNIPPLRQFAFIFFILGIFMFIGFLFVGNIRWAFPTISVFFIVGFLFLFMDKKEAKTGYMRNKYTSVFLALFFGTFGFHKYYLNSKKWILYFLFCWTTIPTIVGFVDFVILFLMSNDNFNKKYNLTEL